MGKFEIYKDRKGEYRWRLLANNNQVIATGEGYASKAGCKNGIASVKKNAPKAKIDDQAQLNSRILSTTAFGVAKGTKGDLTSQDTYPVRRHPGAKWAWIWYRGYCK